MKFLNLLPFAAAALLATQLVGAEPASDVFTSQLNSLLRQASQSDEAFVENEPRIKAFADSAPTEREQGAVLSALIGIFRANSPDDWKRMRGYVEKALTLDLAEIDAFAVERAYIRILERETVFPLSDQRRQELLAHYVHALALVISHPAGAKQATIPMPHVNQLSPSNPRYAEEDKKMAEAAALQKSAKDHNRMVAALRPLDEGMLNLYAGMDRKLVATDLEVLKAQPPVKEYITGVIAQTRP